MEVIQKCMTKTQFPEAIGPEQNAVFESDLRGGEVKLHMTENRQRAVETFSKTAKLGGKISGASTLRSNHALLSEIQPQEQRFGMKHTRKNAMNHNQRKWCSRCVLEKCADNSQPRGALSEAETRNAVPH